MKPIEIIPPVYFYLWIGLMALAHFTLPIMTVLTLPWKLLGGIPLAVGAAFNIIADRDFKLRGTTVKPTGEATALITTGVFRLSRHPMYVGFVLILVGIAALLGSLMPFILAAVFAVFMDVVFIRFEEAKMEKSFGPQWLEYRGRVRRWL
jgi:protein-S-isoprenylcysteine O-methyltransferase Ste14